MKVLNKIKSIYLLTIIAILSFCMLLFPAMPKTANADGEALGSGTITIKSFSVIAQTFEHELDSEGNSIPCDPYDKWAISFKAEITKEQFDSITNNGTVNARFGMLIGRTSRTEGIESKDIATITGAKNTGGLAFEAFAHVGLGLGAQQIEFTEDDTTFEFEAGIVYNEKTNLPEGKTLIDMASYDLTAIPFYMNGATIEESTEIEILFDAKKNVVPKNILVQSYTYQEFENGGKPFVENSIEFKETMIDKFAGDTTLIDDTYICRSTNRFMVPNENDVLVPASIKSDSLIYGSGLAYNPVSVVKADGKADTFDTTFVGGLAKYSEGNIIDYTVDGENNPIVNIYRAKTAERVITRFADTQIGVTATDDTADYLAKAGTDTYTSIFAVKNGVTNMFATKDAAAADKYDVGMVYVSMDKGYDGLYVLGDHISFDGAYAYNVYTGPSFSTTITSSAGTNARQSFVAPIYGLGFGGIFDGRGFAVNANQKANQGIFPSSFDATVKNTAFLGLTQTIDGGGIMAHARASRFENIYAVVASATNARADLNKGILMNVQDCEFKNFVAMVDLANNAMANAPDKPTTGTAAGNQGHGQGVTFGGVFSFRAYADMYYSEDINGVRFADYNNAAAFATDILADLGSLEEVERLFSNAIGWSNGYIVGTTCINNGRTTHTNPAPFTKSGYNNTNRKYAKELSTAFVGTTGENVYTIGSSPLYMAQQFNETTSNTNINISTSNIATYAFDTTTVFVNEAPKLVNGGEADILGWRLENGSHIAPTAYVMNEIADGMFAIDGKADESGNYTLGEISFYGMTFKCAASRTRHLVGDTSSKYTFSSLLSFAPDTKLKVQFISQEGFYDVATASDMAQYVNANAESGITFDSAFWNVVDGVATWKNLPTQA